MVETIWTAEKMRDLENLWNAGHATSEIARRLNVSKNAVVGKAHRLQLQARPSPLKHVGKGSRVAANQRYAALRGTCSWPIGHPGTPEFGFCDKPAQSGKPYCSDHCKEAYAKPTTQPQYYYR